MNGTDPDINSLSINTVTLGWDIDLRTAIDACSRHDIRCLDPWRHQIDKIGIDEFSRMIAYEGMQVSGLCRGGMFTSLSDRNYREIIDDNHKAIDEAAALNADCLVLVVGGLVPDAKDLAASRDLVLQGISDILNYARKNKVKLAIEPLHPMYAADRACINTLSHALDICESLGEGLGVIIDVYHVWWDRELLLQIQRAGRQNLIFGFHISDWLVPTEHLFLDRGMMGDGVIELDKIRNWIKDAGYNGYIEVEILSQNNWWRKSADEIIMICLERYKKFL